MFNYDEFYSGFGTEFIKLAGLGDLPFDIGSAFTGMKEIGKSLVNSGPAQQISKYVAESQPVQRFARQAGGKAINTATEGMAGIDESTGKMKFDGSKLIPFIGNQIKQHPLLSGAVGGAGVLGIGLLLKNIFSSNQPEQPQQQMMAPQSQQPRNNFSFAKPELTA